MKRHQEAIECYNKSIELNPNDSDAYFNKGIALGNYDECSRYYSVALQSANNEIIHDKVYYR